jgi:hypothetical protein
MSRAPLATDSARTRTAVIGGSPASTLAVALLLTQLLVACGSPRATTGERNRKTEEQFKLRCSSAGEQIRRTVKDVEGIFLLKLRPSDLNYSDQFRMDDPYGRDFGGERYIKSFLKATRELDRAYAALRKNSAPPERDELFGYSYVEAVDSADGRRYRYTAYLAQPGKTDPRYLLEYFKVVLQRSPAPGAMPRYGVTYDDISTREDRLAWIAGSSLKVIDLQTQEVVGERIGYMMDRGQGASGGGRSPWLSAASTACPAFPGQHAEQVGQTIRFVEKVLGPARSPDGF